jgi:GT2 family glycosyltransferase
VIEPRLPRLTAVVVHWHDEARLHRLLQTWPDDPGLEVLVVDNGSTTELPDNVVVLRPGRNLGFAGAVNLGARQARAPIVLILNTDVRPRPGAVDALVHGFECWPDAAALAPRLLGPAGESQTAWQIRSLPGVPTLLLQSLLLPIGGGPPTEPAAGQMIEQPAAAVLAVRRRVFEELGGFDEDFYPAWFEDVDFATRMRTVQQPIRYWPAAEFDHDLGSSVPLLGYSQFLRIYHTNLRRYLSKHFGPAWPVLSRLLLAPAALARLLLVPIRKPRRAVSRLEAARGLLALALHTLTGWPPPRLAAVPRGRPPAEAGTKT